MAKQLRTRFAVRRDGQLREILSVKEAATGELRILPRTERYSLGGPIDGPLILPPQRISSTHFSVHPTPKSNGILIKFTQVYTGKRENTVAQFIQNGKSRINNVVFAKLCPTLTHEYELRAAPSDEVYELTEMFSADHTSFVYSVVVTNELTPEQIPAGFQMSWVRFKQWFVCVMWAHCTLPSRTSGPMQVVGTSTPRVNGKARLIGKPIPTEALNNDALKAKVLGEVSGCAFSHQARIAATMISPIREAFLAQEFWFHSTRFAVEKGRLFRRDHIFI